MGYAHADHAVTLVSSGGEGDGQQVQAEVQLNSTELLGEGVGLPDVAPAASAAVQAAVAARAPQLQVS